MSISAVVFCTKKKGFALGQFLASSLLEAQIQQLLFLTTSITTLHTQFRGSHTYLTHCRPRTCPFTYIKKLHARNAEKRKLTLAILALVTENEVLSKKKEGTPFRALSGTGR